MKGTLKVIFGSLLLIFNLISLNSCRQYGDKNNILQDDEEESCNPNRLLSVFLVPMDGISDAEITLLKENFIKNFTDSLREITEVQILPHILRHDSCLNDKKTRLSARRTLLFVENYYKREAKEIAESKKETAKYSNWYVIGVTNKDIATNIHGSDDYGILGLSFLSQHNASIISTKRLRDKKDLWKLAAHEFCHGFYGAHHCPNDDPKCILQDAKGGNPHFELKENLCSSCAALCGFD